jgi:low temperature requirement protein LtrA
LPLVAGIIAAAVGDELVLAHPSGHIDAATAAALLGGPALYLVGNLMFKRATADRPALSHMIGIALLAASIFLVPFVGPHTFSLTTTAVLVLVAVWESLSLKAPPAGRVTSSAGTPAVT